MKIQTFSGRLAAISVAALLMLSACGGGGDGATPVGTGTGGGTGGSAGAGAADSGGAGVSGGSTGGTVVSKATVGGTISGLTVDGMALLNNGADKLNVSNAATTFKFATSLLSGSAYDVSFASYPYGLACSLSGQTGTVTADITSVAIACADWTAANATVSVFAGSTFGTADGTGAAAQFGSLFGLGFDASGTLYIADRDNNMIRKITASGVVTTLAGSTTSGSLDGTGTSARFNLPAGIAVDSGGDVYVADRDNNMIRKITPTGVVTTVAGSTTAGNLDGTGTAARFNMPWGIVVDGSGNLFVADQSNNEIRKITPAGVVTTFAGAGPSSPGFADGLGTAATFSQPSGLAIDANGNLYVADQLNHAVRKITPAGLVTTVAGNGLGGNLDGTGAAARFQNPIGVAVDGAGNVYVADMQNNKIRKISASGVVITLAGAASSGLTNGLGSAARFNMPLGVALDPMGNVYVADSGNTVVRKIARVP